VIRGFSPKPPVGLEVAVLPAAVVRVLPHHRLKTQLLLWTSALLRTPEGPVRWLHCRKVLPVRVARGRRGYRRFLYVVLRMITAPFPEQNRGLYSCRCPGGLGKQGTRERIHRPAVRPQGSR
jgi:hypothetical protein